MRLRISPLLAEGLRSPDVSRNPFHLLPKFTVCVSEAEFPSKARAHRLQLTVKLALPGTVPDFAPDEQARHSERQQRRLLFLKAVEKRKSARKHFKLGA